jgi:hypothetical protein
MNNCFEHDQLCFLTTIIVFIRNMLNIRYAHLIITKDDVEYFLDIYEWQTLVNRSLKLNKIILQVTGNTFQNKQLTQKALNIQKELRNIRKTIKFQIKFL